MNKFLIAIFTVLLFSACNKQDDPDPSPVPYPVAERTVLVYMAGENNLTKDDSYPGESYLADDYEELLEGSYSLNSRQHLVLFIDSVGRDNPPHIVEMADGKVTDVYRYDEDFYSCDADKMLEVMNLVMEKYPSTEYGLVLWGHASGWAMSIDSIASSAKARTSTRAYGQDQGWDVTGGTVHWMNITQMARALEQLPKKLLYIFADCCCFQCLESAYELHNSAEWLIGSPAEIPGEGAPYHKMVPKLFSNSTTFYKDICDCYYDYFIDAYQSHDYTQYSDLAYLIGYSVPMSAFKLSKMDDLATATKNILPTFMPVYPEQLDMSGVPFYFGYSNVSAMFDPKTVIQKFASASDYAQWLSVYNQAVPCQLVSRVWMTMYGYQYNRFGTFPTDESLWGSTSMFFPQASYTSHPYRYNERIKYLQWYNAINWPAFGL